MKPRLLRSGSKSTGVFALPSVRLLCSFLLIYGFFAQNAFAQTHLPECTATVPFFNLDLSASPDMSYTTPEVIRQPGCCGDGDNYISFYVILNPNVAQFEIVVAPGYADPGGSGNYNIISGGDLTTPGSCGVQIPGGSPICITGSGPHKIIYSKPGKNKIKYIFRQIPKPIFPVDQSTRIGCSLPLSIFGLNSITITSINSSTGNTTPGAYNSLLSCTNCSNPSFSPGLGTPDWIDYKICGTPKAAACGVFQNCDTVRLYTYGALSLTATPNPATFCQGGSGVLLTATATGGDGAYIYRWRNSSGTIVSNSSNYTATTAGTYTAEVTDGLSTATCPDAFVSVPVTIATTPVVSAGVDQIVCATSPTVLLHATSTTGSGIWSGGSGSFQPDGSSLITSYTPSAAEINNGSVTLTFTSTGAGGGCLNSDDQMTITLSDTVVSQPIAGTIACYNGSTTINAGQTGGTAPFSYLWSTGSSGNSISVTAGTYLLTVTDQYGCYGIVPVTVAQPAPLALNLSTTTANSPTCDGTASVTINGGTPPYSILWTNGQTTATASSLCEGVVSVTVTDSHGCVITQSAVVNNTFCNTFDVGISSSTNVSCHGGNDGSATVSIVSGGTAPFSYSWNTSPVQTGPTASNLVSGTYSVTVTDNSGCQDVVAITILQPTIITNTVTHVDVSSIGGSNGSATANPLGGTPGYTYLWAPGGQTTQTASNLSSAVGGVTYHVAITDANLCLMNDSVHINQPPCNNFIASVNPTNVSCNGLTNGAAALVIANGTSPFSISWSNGVNNAMSVSNLASGNYTVTVTDFKNCSTFSNFSIIQPAPLSISLVPTNVSCNGANNGTIDLTVSGGTYPYTFTWSSGGNTIASHEDLIQLAPGTYSVVVTDAKGCSISGSVGIMQPAAITTSYTYSDNPCYGNSLGSVDLTVNGGSVPYSYAWAGPSGFTATSQDLSGLSSGLYQVIVTDLHGCSALLSVDVYINQPEVLSALASMSQQVSCAGASNGAIAIMTTGGTVPYAYAWTGPSSYSSTAEDISGLIAGNYQVIITDAHGCTTSTSASVTTIPDTIPPVVSCTTDKSVVTSSSACKYTVPNISWNASATDNCFLASLTFALSGATTGTGTSLSGVEFNKGITLVTWVATDGLGNTDTCTFNVTVADNVNPIITQCGPSTPASVIANAGVCTYTNSGSAWDVVATDNCGIDSVRYNLSGATTGVGISLNGVIFNLGITTVTWTVYDASGNSTTCSATVTVSDNQLPIIVSCGAAGTQNVLANVGVCTYTHTGTSWDASVTDNCSVASVSYTLSGATTGTGTTLNSIVFNQGTTLVSWQALDGSGNSSICTFNVIVGDNQNPVITNCSAIDKQTVNANVGLCTYTHNSNSWNAVATDNCTVSSLAYGLSGATTGTGTTLNGVQFNLGVTTVTWTATDAAGNTTICTFTVTVIDTQLPVILSCGAAGNQSVVADAGQCTYTQTSNAWDASASDNCSVASVNYVLTGATTGTGTSLSGVVFNLGTTTVTWTATDGSGNTSFCTFNVLVSDNQLPVILSCGAAGNQSVVADAGQCTYTQTSNAWNASASDNCSVASVNYVLTGATTGTGSSLSGVVFNLGTTTVTWTATDGSGNTSSCIFNVLVSDSQLPVILSCGAAGNQSLVADDGLCTYTQTSNAWDASAADNCSVASVSYTLSGATTGTGTTLNGVVFNQGTTLVTWQALDGSGNSSICTFNVIVGDNQNPVISNCSAIGNQIVNANVGLCTYTHNSNSWNAVATDNCTVSSLAYSLSGATTGTGTSLNGVQFNLGVTTVTWTATDVAGNTTICTFSVTVNDTQLPVILSCGAAGNQSVVADAGQCTYTQTSNAWDASASDNCSVASVNYVLTGATTGTGTSLSGVVFNLGTTTVTWTATDGSGNTSSCTFNVLVSDSQLPVILSCGAAGNQSVVADIGLCTYTQTSNAWDASASDNCSVASVNYVLTGATTGTGTSLSGVVFNLGTTTVTWTATDGSGNTSSCTFNVLVSDSQLPVILSCGAAGNQSVVADIGLCTYTQTSNAWDASASDNCSVASVNYVLTGATTGTGSSLSGVVFNLGTTTVTWTATDGSGNTSSCTFNVLVSDNQRPSIVSCGANGTQNVLANAGVCTYTHAGTAWDASAADNCSVASVSYTLSGATTGTGTTLNGVVFNQGTTLVTWQALDGSGNSSICTFNVIVGDNQNPVISNCSAIGNQIVNANVGLCTYTHNSNSWNAVATDNCTVSSLAYSLSGATTGTGTSLNGVQFNLGVTTVTWTATDVAGNTTICTFSVTVNDTQLPVILSCGAAGNQSVVADAGQCTYTQTSNAWDASASDNCSVASVNYVLTGATTGTGTSLSGVVFNLGTTTVTWTATDGSGNTSSCTFNVVVSDNQLPVITSCGPGGNQNVSTDAGLCTYTNSGNGWNAVATDNCTVTSLTYTLTGATSGTGTSLNGVVFNQGITTVTWTAVDTAGNQVQCQFTVTVTDDESPVIVNCPASISQNSDAEQCGAIVNWVVPSFSDNCGATISGTATPGNYFPVGVSNVSYTVVDNAGNSTSCSFSITITDAEAPVIDCPDTVATCNPLVEYPLPTVSDNCGVASLVQTAGLPSGSIFPIGVTVNTFVVTDIHGNISNCSFTVRIYPTPVSATTIDQVSCNGFGDASVDLQISNGTAPYQTNWSNNATSEDLTNLSPGTYTVAIIDNHGCMTADTVTITEPEALGIETRLNQLSCYNANNGSIQTSVSGGILPYTYNWLSGEQTPDLSNLSAGNYSLTVTDANGCVLTFSTTITQPDSLMLQAVIINATCNASNGSIQIQVTGGTTSYGYDWSNGTSNQNLNNASAGSYNVLVTDANGCQVAYSGVILSVTNLNAAAMVTDVSCYGDDNGEATVVISNGNEPYTYQWSNGGVGAHQTDLSGGTYSVLITDEYGCTVVLEVFVGEPDSLSIDLTLSSYLLGYNISTNGGSDGSISALVSGGTIPYSYSWSTTDTTNQISNLSAGGYSLSVTDGNGCTATVVVELRQPDVLEMPQGFSPNADGDNDYFVVHGIKSYPENSIKVFNRWGNIVYQRDSYADEWYGENNAGDALPDATYFVILNVVVGGKDKVLQGYVDLRRK
ncbi:HYR domain protein [compost metagenome]